MPNDDRDARELWQAQEVEKMTITVDEIRSRAMRFERRVYWRNIRESVAAVVVIALFAFYALHAGLRNGWPQWLLIAGVVYAMWQLHRRGSAHPLPPDSGATSSLHFYRAELERQRDALRAIWSWYLLPLVPGLVALLALQAFRHRINVAWYICVAAFPLCFVLVWKLNQHGAKRLDAKIAELKSMEPKP